MGIRESSLETKTEENISELVGKKLIVGNRVPVKYFWTSGIGEDNEQIHAGSYHLALSDAGIEKCNVMTYSSIMPKDAVEVPLPEEYEFTHGQEICTIEARVDVNKGELGSAGIILGWLYDRDTKEKYGGLVCERNGNLTEDDVKTSLIKSLNILYEKYRQDYDLHVDRIIVRSIKPEKKYGTALVSIGFIQYEMEILGVKK